jgi:hypothetical protein
LDLASRSEFAVEVGVGLFYCHGVEVVHLFVLQGLSLDINPARWFERLGIRWKVVGKTSLHKRKHETSLFGQKTAKYRHAVEYDCTKDKMVTVMMENLVRGRFSADRTKKPGQDSCPGLEKNEADLCDQQPCTPRHLQAGGSGSHMNGASNGDGAKIQHTCSSSLQCVTSMSSIRFRDRSAALQAGLSSSASPSYGHMGRKSTAIFDKLSRLF